MKSYIYLPIVFAAIIFLFMTPYFAAAQNTGGNNGSEQFVSIDFNDVDITVFIKFMSELTGKNFIIDKRVRGKVTIISPSKISVKEAYKVFESVLEVHGFATVEAGEVTKIVSSPEARTKNIKTLLEGERRSTDDKVITQLIPLKYAEPRDIKRLFAPLISKSSVMLDYDPTNTLIITDVYSNIRRLLKILEKIDVPGTGQEISVIQIEYADATKLDKVLNSIFQQKRRKRKRGASDDTIKFVADERTNSIIVLASEEDTIKIKELISRLDREIPKGKEKIHVYYLENATAEELAKVLQSLSTKKSRTTRKKGKKEAPIVSEGVNITADKATNSLIIMAEKDDYLILEEIIKKLDIPRSMVYIECLIMEVNVDKEFNLGAEWIAGGKAGYGDNKDAYIGTGFGGGESAYSGISGVVGGAASGGALMPRGFSLGIFGEALKVGSSTFYNLGALAQAYKEDKSTNILSTPQLLTTDNEEASIYVGKNVPYLTKSGTTSTTVDQYNTYEYKDVGKTLKVTPQISKDRRIRLKIYQEVTELDQQQDTGENRPTTLKRTFETTVIVDDKNTIVIGGLIGDSFSEIEHKIPCLGDLPGLGWLFKSLSKGRSKTNLFVFLTPHVIQHPDEAKQVYEKKKEHIETVGEKQKSIKLYERYFDELPDIEEEASDPVK